MRARSPMREIALIGTLVLSDAKRNLLYLCVVSPNLINGIDPMDVIREGTCSDQDSQVENGTTDPSQSSD